MNRLQEALKFVHPNPSLKLHQVHYQDGYIIASDGFSIYRAYYKTQENEKFFNDEFIAKFFNAHLPFISVDGENMLQAVLTLENISAKEDHPHLRVGITEEGYTNYHYECEGTRYHEHSEGEESVMEFDAKGYKIDIPPTRVAFNFNANCVNFYLPGSRMVILKNTKGE